MLNKIKTILRVVKKVLIVSVVLVVLIAIGGGTMYACYTAGQLSACNAMLRNSPETRRFGLYCEQMPEGIVVRSTVLKKSLFNITTDIFYY